MRGGDRNHLGTGVRCAGKGPESPLDLGSLPPCRRLLVPDARRTCDLRPRGGRLTPCELDGNRTFLVIEGGVRDAAGNLDLAALLVQSCSAGEDASVGGLRPRSVTRKGRGLEIGVMLLGRDASDQFRDSRVSGPSMLFKQARPVRKRSAMRLIRGAASRPGIVGDLRCFATVGCILEPVERADRFS